MLPRFLLSAVLCTAAVAAQAEQLDPAYVAYAEVPGPGRSFYLLVAMEDCPEKNAPDGWQRGAYLYTYGEEPACWKLDGEKVRFCPQGQYETVYRENGGATTVDSCHLWSKEEFYER